MREGISKLLDS